MSKKGKRELEWDLAQPDRELTDTNEALARSAAALAATEAEAEALKAIKKVEVEALKETLKIRESTNADLQARRPQRTPVRYSPRCSMRVQLTPS